MAKKERASPEMSYFWEKSHERAGEEKIKYISPLSPTNICIRERGGKNFFAAAQQF
jgi:hypothetical protein